MADTRNNGKPRKQHLRFLKHSPKSVALVGMGPSIMDIFAETLTQEMTPEFADEIWAINMVANLAPA